MPRMIADDLTIPPRFARTPPGGRRGIVGRPQITEHRVFQRLVVIRVIRVIRG
jgi:hypothetical protein